MFSSLTSSSEEKRPSSRLMKLVSIVRKETAVRQDRKNGLLKPIAQESTVVTDGLTGFKGIESLGFRHQVVIHNGNEWVNKEGYTTNHIEAYSDASVSVFLQTTGQEKAV
ncbi:hypothetical protein BLNAU_6242 [Blattamonas nauphoetae]|uniref:ISXO2-like transposase domain-containing protein n=1 Tax=Blattamonas nauphoetae TaxID=2049346 RepID=A0ABQ9Y4U6_9EUKA|nr:hypothetical protein BLNAU_6242 [Blattamonas nauphoetae]